MAISRNARRRIVVTAALLLGDRPDRPVAHCAERRTGRRRRTERIRVVNVAQRGAPPTGPAAVVIEHDQTLATHTIYRPADLGGAKHGVLVWGEGGCAKNGLTFPEFLTELASHGFVIIADGPPVENAGRRGAPGGGGAPGAAGPAAAPGAGGAPRAGGAPVAGGPPAGAAPAPGPEAVPDRPRRRGDDRWLGAHRRDRLDREGRQRQARAASIRRSMPAASPRWGCRAAD